ncbi:MAG TPA: hypothetical protein PLW48_09840 [Alphaproteobacteria bacterium]|nr:hypothetical protein [Rhodospirillaceae bacterium]HRJ67425.1 hypothetical protein [Alphaproteobacteria bacterium]
MPTVTFRTLLPACALAMMLSACHTDGHSSQTSSGNRMPGLVVSSEPPPEVIYRRGSRDTVLAGQESSALRGYSSQNIETLVTRKVAELRRDLDSLKRSTNGYGDRLKTLQVKSDAAAAQYYEQVATINTELQAGSTPGNPVLVERWNTAQERLESLSQNAAHLNGLATDLANEASKASYLQENVRAAYGLSGAVKEDHVKLRALEDEVNQNIVTLNRLLTSTSDEINRRQAYLRTEKLNLQTMSLAVANGELYGQNLSNSLFKRATQEATTFSAPAAQNPASRRPLVIIRFDRSNVNYEQQLYTAVGQALEKYPAAKFDLVAVSPSQGNAAEMALASTEARKNGENVLRSLTQMGLPLERVRLNAANSSGVRNSEVHLYLQ